MIRKTYYASLFLSLGLLGACKTSGDLRPGESVSSIDPEEIDDPTGAKTESLPSTGASENPSQQVAILQGELENTRAQSRQSEDKLRARVSELEAENAKLKEDLAKAATAVPTPPPALSAGGGKGGASLWDLAMKDLRDNKLNEALINFEELARSYPKDTRHFHALIGAGYIHYKLKQYKEAAVVFNQAIDKHTKHASLGQAWFGGGASLAQMGQLEDSKLFFSEVVKRFPKSPEASVAKAIMAKKRKVPADLLVLFPAWSTR